jgi:hypothetical protein
MKTTTIDNRRTMARFACRIAVGMCGLAVLVGESVPTEAAPLNKEEQARVNRAIDEGVSYLKRSQGAHGSWAGPKEKHVVGYAVLPGLTLLECGVATDEQAIRRVAAIVRRAAPTLDGTYEIALSILFLDRRGDAKDRELIQTLAVRLIAGQSETGGWTYKCPHVGVKTQEEILAALRKLDPPEPLAGIAAFGRDPLGGTIQRKPANPPLEGTTGKSSGTSSPGGVPELPPPAEPKAKPPVKEKVKPADPPVEVPARLKRLPVFQDVEQLQMKEAKSRGRGRGPSVTDNSNTQFAILALWVAQRHEVPARRTMQLMVRRFENSQNRDGSWDYHYVYGGGDEERPAMTCVGLLGLAVGQGMARQPRQPADPKPLADGRIRDGLTALSKNVGSATGNWRDRPMENLYFLWSVERVGVLFGLTEIGEHDWYRWGAEILIANQQKRGYWTSSKYPGSSPTIDTCLALLFLKRANFVADLSKRLPFQPKELSGTIIRSLPPSRSPGESRDPEKKP